MIHHARLPKLCKRFVTLECRFANPQGRRVKLSGNQASEFLSLCCMARRLEPTLCCKEQGLGWRWLRPRDLKMSLRLDGRRALGSTTFFLIESRRWLAGNCDLASRSGQ